MKILAQLFFIVVFTVSNVCAGEPPFLWFYLSTNMLVEKNVEENIALIRRAGAAGYNGVVLTDSKFWRWDKLPERYRANVKRVRDACRDQGIACFAAVCPMGYSNELLSNDPNLAEGLPVTNAPFIVRDGQLIPEPPAEPILRNGSFERHRNNMPEAWGFADAPGRISFLDGATVVDGAVSLRMQNIGDEEPRNGRVMQRIDVKPFQYYRVSVMVKTEDFDAVANVRIAALAPDGRALNHHMPRIEPTQGWRKINVAFNSLTNTSVNFYLGVWGGRGGKIWWDATTVEPAGFVNIIRRDTTPLTIIGADGKVYTEGPDFTHVIDPLLGNDPYEGCFSAWHEPLRVTIPVGSRLAEGQRVFASYTHATIIYSDQVAACMAASGTEQHIRKQLAQIRDYVAPDGYFMSHDEIRQQGWDADCEASGKTPAELLVANVRMCADAIRAIDPGKPVAVWSDMFDPYHNAKSDGLYYLVKGTGPWHGAWQGLPSDVIVVNWNSGAQRTDSLRHFDERGNRQILAGYYDGDVNAIRAWLRDARPFSRVSGVMYTTWAHRFVDLERFAEIVREEWRTADSHR